MLARRGGYLSACVIPPLTRYCARSTKSECPLRHSPRVAEDQRGRTLCGDPIVASSPWLHESGRMLGSGLPGWRRVAALYVPLACPAGTLAQQSSVSSCATHRARVWAWLCQALPGSASVPGQSETAHTPSRRAHMLEMSSRLDLVRTTLDRPDSASQDGLYFNQRACDDIVVHLWQRDGSASVCHEGGQTHVPYRR